MTSSQIEFLGHPSGLDDTAEYLHPAPTDPEPALWGDTMWIAFFDPETDLRVINHVHMTNRGFGRFQTHAWIDGIKQVWGTRAPATLDPALTRWSDGHLSYEVVEPFKTIRVTQDNDLFGFDVTCTARFPAFDYEDCAGGNPLWVLKQVAPSHGGHFEQALWCEGSFEIRGGPHQGETRRIATLGHRDRTWSDRFSGSRPWVDREDDDAGLHFWLILCFPDRDVHGFGYFDPAAHGALPGTGGGRGGAVMSGRGSQRVTHVEPVPEYAGDASGLRKSHGPERWRFTLEGGEVLHVRVTRYRDRAHLWLRGVNDLDRTLDDWEDVVDIEVEETGETGFGVIEYSVLPVSPRWIA